MSTLRKGDSGSEVKYLQRLLGVTADGIFGSNTETAVKEFQKNNNLTADGIVGQKTWTALESSSNKLSTQESDYGISITVKGITNNITKKSRSIEYLAIHYTAGASSEKGNALSTRNYFQKSNTNASADFIVDDETIIQTNSNIYNYYCWAVGDGNGKNGITNSNSISVELCSTLKSGASSKYPNHAGWSFTEAVLDNGARLARYLMKKYDIPYDNVVRHYDASGKACPGIIGWNNSALYTEDGKVTSESNNSEEWDKFKERLKGQDENRQERTH